MRKVGAWGAADQSKGSAASPRAAPPSSVLRGVATPLAAAGLLPQGGKSSVASVAAATTAANDTQAESVHPLTPCCSSATQCATACWQRTQALDRLLLNHCAAPAPTVGNGACMGPSRWRSSRRRGDTGASACCVCVVYNTPLASEAGGGDTRVCCQSLTWVVDTSQRSRTRRDALWRHSRRATRLGAILRGGRRSGRVRLLTLGRSGGATHVARATSRVYHAVCSSS